MVKVNSEEIRPLGNNCALQLTTAYYYFPDNSTPHAVGITPDFVVPFVKTSLKKKLIDGSDPRLAYLVQD